MGFFTFVSIIREPVQEWNLMPTKELRSRNYYQPNIGVGGMVPLNVVIDISLGTFQYPVNISVRGSLFDDGRSRFTNESPFWI